MPQTIYSVIKRYITEIEETTSDTFDVVILNKAIKVQNESVNIGVANIANLLWTKTEKLADVIYLHTCNVTLLEQILSRKRDTLSNESYLEQINTQFGTKSLINHFWLHVSSILDKELKNSSKSIYLPYYSFEYSASSSSSWLPKTLANIPRHVPAYISSQHSWCHVFIMGTLRTLSSTDTVVF